MKTIKYTPIFLFASLLTFGMSGCSEKEDLSADSEQGIEITAINLSMAGRTGETGTATRAAATSIEGFSVNQAADPTFKGLNERSGWKMDFNLYYNKGDHATGAIYGNGSFTGISYNGESTLSLSDKRFPNYTKQDAEAFLYPATWTMGSSAPATDQAEASKLLAQDVLVREKALIEVAHIINLNFIHKHAMLDFVIKDVVAGDIVENGVTVIVGNQTYTPYKGTATAATAAVVDLEYMVILPEGTAENPIVEIKTNSGSNNSSSITYKQIISIIDDKTPTLGSNQCYCFTLQGVDLKISPVTVLNWTSGVSIPGEYIVVTAYPTFKAVNHANTTYYFYYDNKLVDQDGKAQLQKIEFNQSGECTIKPDGRVLTHIFTSADAVPDKGNALATPIVLGAMVIDLGMTIDALNP